MRSRAWTVPAVLVISTILVIAVLALPGAANAQVLLDNILVRVNGEIITRSDVEQARALKLIPSTDAQVIRTELENRHLILAEAARYPPPEPSADAIAAERRRWQAQVGDVDVPALLTRYGMSETSLAAWLRDDLRIRAYLDRQFAATAIPMKNDVLKYYQEHQAEYTENGNVKAFADVEADVRAKLAVRDRAAAIAKWIAGLRGRADIR
jgi:hypothetical protein